VEVKRENKRKHKTTEHLAATMAHTIKINLSYELLIVIFMHIFSGKNVLPPMSDGPLPLPFIGCSFFSLMNVLKIIFCASPSAECCVTHRSQTVLTRNSQLSAGSWKNGWLVGKSCLSQSCLSVACQSAVDRSAER